MIVIVDYGMGNLGSIVNMLKKVGHAALVSSKPDEILGAEKLILPGVGAFDNAMKNLAELELIPVLEEKILRQGAPILGVCLGMQLLTEKSQEGSRAGLGWINGETVRFSFGDNPDGLKVPHMGWNTVSIQKQSCLFNEMDDEPRFYFVHSYHVVCRKEIDILTTTYYGYDFVSSVVRENIMGVQFHPEKSHRFGMKVLKNFAEKF